MRTVAVLPIKSFSRAKSRLGEQFDRSELAAAMAHDSLDALAATPGVDDVIVVTGEPLADDTCAVFVPDPDEAVSRPQPSGRAAGDAAPTRVLCPPTARAAPDDPAACP